STVFSEAELTELFADVIGQSLTIEEINTLADRVTQLYLNEGYLTSRAIIDSYADGNIVIGVIEGKVTEIIIESPPEKKTRLEKYVRSRVKLGSRTPLKAKKLEDQLRLLKNDPLIENIEASLRAGEKQGESIVVVRVTDADNWTGRIGIDNYSPPSIGSERLNLALAYRNLTGIGDTIGFSFTPRTANLDTFQLQFNYLAPLNPMNGTLALSTIIDRNEVIQEPFDVLDIEGEAEQYDITYRQPLVRNPRQEFALSLGFSYRDGQTFTFAGPTPFGLGPSDEGETTISVIKFGQDYTIRQEDGAWAFRSLLNFGVDLFDSTENSGSTPDSQFLSWLGQIQRVQVLDDDNFLIIGLDLQLSNDPLLAAQQFVIGGGQSVRGYRQNVLAGDNGFRFSIEDRITVQRDEAENAILQIAPFIDMGAVWNAKDNPNGIVEDQTFIIALGLGFIWEPVEGFNIRLDYAPPLIELDSKGENVQDHGFYFNATYSF
ncbi:MAG: ShlB/FhaC/HecB family hemolysin secretion/activation protein, partial [Cyanobacteria bacterium J083]